MSKTTKTVSLTQEFLRAAAGNEDKALAYQLMMAFGVTLATCLDAVNKAISTKDSKIIVLMMASGVQVRGNVTFVGREYANIRSVYPSLVIEGDRNVKDVFNFGALHVCGHILAIITRNALGGKILAKAGNCVTGEGTTDTEAGKINAELAKSWTRVDRDEFAIWLAENSKWAQEIIDPIVEGFAVMSSEFSNKLTGKTPATPARSEDAE